MYDLWERALQDLKGKLSSENFDTWLAPLVVEHADGSALTLRVPNKFHADWLQTHYLELMLDVLQGHGASDELRLDFTVMPAQPRVHARASEPPPAPRPRSQPPQSFGAGSPQM